MTTTWRFIFVTEGVPLILLALIETAIWCGS